MELYLIYYDYFLRQHGKFCDLLTSALVKYISLAITLNVATEKLLFNDYDVCISSKQLSNMSSHQTYFNIVPCVNSIVLTLF